MIIGMMGFECVSANKGCEALCYSFVDILKQICGDGFELYIFSNVETGRFADYYPNIKIVRIPLKIRDYQAKMIRAMAQCDYIFDVTVGDSFSDIYSKEQCLCNMKFKYLAEVFGRKYILLPQTYGPFYDENVARKAKRIIRKAYKVYSRDRQSKKYIVEQMLPALKVYEMTDLAFVLPYDKKMFSVDHNKLNIGINVSGLLWKGGFSHNNQFQIQFDYQVFVERMIELLLEDSEIRIHLIPHVIDLNEDSYDDDYKCQRYLSNKYGIDMAPAFENPIEAKSYISNMDCFIGSRMHSTIAAISCGIPTLPVSYSRKFEGLFETLQYPYMIHGNDMGLEAALSLIAALKGNLKDMRERAKKSKEIADSMINDFCSDLKLLLDGGE